MGVFLEEVVELSKSYVPTVLPDFSADGWGEFAIIMACLLMRKMGFRLINCGEL